MCLPGPLTQVEGDGGTCLSGIGTRCQREPGPDTPLPPPPPQSHEQSVPSSAHGAGCWDQVLSPTLCP